MKNKHTFKDRLRYHFDNYMSRGTGALIGGLALASFLLILVAAITIVLVRLPKPDEGGGLGFGEALWQTMLHSIDTGTLAGDTGWSQRLVMLFVTLGGIFILSALIGVLGSGLEMRLNELRKGRSRVIESGHTVILGWSPQIFPILEELAIANQGRGKTCIAILADRDKVDMEDEIREKLGKPRDLSIVCRSGNPMDLDDLEIINPHESKAIIILATDWQYHDADVLKTCLALINNPGRRPQPYHIVGSLRNPATQEVARLISSGGEAILFQVNELIARITAQSCRQSGLSLVYEELLDFSRDKIYFKTEPGLVGDTFAEALSRYEESSVIGLAKAGGEILLNPPMETPLRFDDQLIVISRAEPLLAPVDMTAQIAVEAIQLTQPAPRKPERTLILGWNARGARIIENLDSYVLAGSEVRVVCEIGGFEQQITALAGKLANQTIQYQAGATFSRAVLEGLDVPHYDHIVLLSYAPEIETQRADSITMVSLLHLRDMANKLGQSYPIVSEIMDIRNRDLIQVANVDDFIISDRLVSLTLAQLAENKQILGIFLDLLNVEGAEIYLKPIEEYIRVGQPVNFYTILEAARQRNETAVGYRIMAEGRDASRRFGVYLNPSKSKPIAFAADDRVIVVAEKQ
jgi:voltage-gated potassium channel Kch